MSESIKDRTTQYHTRDTAETMADVRHEVDRIDRLLVELLVERQSFMDAAARIKGQRNSVLDRPRIEDVVAKVKDEHDELKRQLDTLQQSRADLQKLDSNE